MNVKKRMKRVNVISIDDKPLMPCTAIVARLLLKQGKAKVKRREPFTIKLNYKTKTEIVQKTTLGIDTGAVNSAYAVSVDNEKGKKEMLYLSQVQNRTDIKDKMDGRRKYRRNRRTRKTRHRKPRFLNRANSKKEGRLPPTAKSIVETHLREINFIKKILPVDVIVLEVGNFDPHLMKKPKLADPEYRKWGYQKGANYGFENTKAKVRYRDDYTCQCCKGKSKDKVLEVHHIIYRSNGGSDDESNLITLCHRCHSKLHAGTLKKRIDFEGMKKGNLKHATMMNIVRSQLEKRVDEYIETYGYITKGNRQELNLKKDHYVDACVIATAGRPFELLTPLYKKVCNPKGDFQQTKGRHSQQHNNTGKIQGFRKFDKVKYMGEYYFIKGRMSTGYCILLDIDGKKIDFSHMPKGFKTPKFKNMKRIAARKSWMITTEEAIVSIA